MTAGQSSQKTLKIDADLFTELEIFLKTPEAKKRGFHSKAPFATHAIRKILEEYTKPRFEHLSFDGSTIRLIDNEKPKGTPYVELFLENNTLMCSSCGTTKCVHVNTCWNDSGIEKILKGKKVKNLIQVQ